MALDLPRIGFALSTLVLVPLIVAQRQFKLLWTQAVAAVWVVFALKGLELNVTAIHQSVVFSQLRILTRNADSVLHVRTILARQCPVAETTNPDRLRLVERLRSPRLLQVGKITPLSLASSNATTKTYNDALLERDMPIAPQVASSGRPRKALGA